MGTNPVTWIRSTFCANAGCAELARHGDQILIRSSRNPERTPLAFSLDEARALFAGLKAGDFDVLLER